MSVAATVATAPLMAHHFGALSVAALPANVLALPAVAPAMWLGMLAAIAGQVPAIPVEPLNWLDSLCLAYIGQVAHWFGAPAWAQLEMTLDHPAAVAGASAALVALVELGLRAGGRRRRLALGRRRSLAPAGAVVGLLAVVVLVPGAVRAGGGDQARSPHSLVVRVLDVGQGDAIVLDPPGGDPILVDTGPPGAGVAGRLGELGMGELGAVVVTHDQSDHAGGTAEVVRSEEVERLGYAGPSADLGRLAQASAAQPLLLAEGSELRSGALRLSVLWPPRALLGVRSEDPNHLSLVLLAEWGHFSMLLTGDAEAETIPIDPGPVDVLKVAHHGSEDAGLPELLDHAAPKLAVISVGENSYGHPTAEALADLAEHDVPVLRTDEDGEVVIEATATGWSAEAG